MGGDITGWSARSKKTNYDERDLSQKSSQSNLCSRYQKSKLEQKENRD